MWRHYTEVLGLNRWLTNAEEAAVSRFLGVCFKYGYMTKLLQGKQEYGFPASLWTAHVHTLTVQQTTLKECTDSWNLVGNIFISELTWEHTYFHTEDSVIYVQNGLNGFWQGFCPLAWHSFQPFTAQTHPHKSVYVAPLFWRLREF